MRRGAPKDAIARKWLQRNGCIAQALAPEGTGSRRMNWKLLIRCGKDSTTARKPMAGRLLPSGLSLPSVIPRHECLWTVFPQSGCVDQSVPARSFVVANRRLFYRLGLEPAHATDYPGTEDDAALRHAPARRRVPGGNCRSPHRDPECERP